MGNRLIQTHTEMRSLKSTLMVIVSLLALSRNRVYTAHAHTHTRASETGWLITHIPMQSWNVYDAVLSVAHGIKKVRTDRMRLKLDLRGLHATGRLLHPCFLHDILCLNHAQTPCTIKSNTFDHRMLKPKGKDKIRNVTGTGRTINRQCMG